MNVNHDMRRPENFDAKKGIIYILCGLELVGTVFMIVVAFVLDYHDEAFNVN